MTTLNGANPDRDRAEQSLDRRYGKIGISAVAAALRYRSETQNHGHLRAAARDEQGHITLRG